MQPGCFECFNTLCMGLKKSKPRRFQEYDGVSSSGVESKTVQSVVEFESIHRDAVTCINAYAPETCLTGGKDNLVVLFNWKQGVTLCQWSGHSRDVTKVKYVGETIYSSSRDKTIKVWQTSKAGNEPILTFEGHRLVVTAIDLNEDARLCA